MEYFGTIRYAIENLDKYPKIAICECEKCGNKKSYTKSAIMQRKQRKLSTFCRSCAFKNALEQKIIEDPDFIQKRTKTIKENVIKKYGSTSNYYKMIRAKNKETLSKKDKQYWENIKNKRKETCLERYGVEYNFQSEETKEKARKTCLKRYGVEVSSQSEVVKEKQFNTNYKKYGTKCSLQNKEVAEKARQTLLKNWGVDNISKSDYFKNEIVPFINYNAGVDIYYDDYHFDSSWELAYYKYLKENNIEFIFHPKEFFEYEYNGKKHIYRPDFKVQETFVEIKGDFFFENEKMINPFDRSQDGIFEAKHQCMIKNKVNILKKSDLESLGIKL